MINQFLFGLDRTTRLIYYNAFGTVMYIVMMALFLWSVKIYKLRIKQASIIGGSYLVAFFLRPALLDLLTRTTNGLVENLNLGVALLPFLVIFSLLVLIFRMNILSALDIAVPVYIGGRGACVIGCLFVGCCHGQYAHWGIYSHQVNYNTVPCPIIDSICSILIAVLLLSFCIRSSAHGKTAAYGLIAFGALRFIIDVLRDNDKIFELVSVEGICGFVYLCIGLVILYLTDKKPKEQI